jgi:hypothetical protein
MRCRGDSVDIVAGETLNFRWQLIATSQNHLVWQDGVAMNIYVDYTPQSVCKQQDFHIGSIRHYIRHRIQLCAGLSLRPRLLAQSMSISPMSHKFLNAFILMSIALTAHAELPEAWLGGHYGECFSSLETGMSAVYGNDYSSDDNIIQHRVVFGSVEMNVSSDATSGENSSRTIFEKRGAAWCITLVSPPVSSLKFVPKIIKKSRPRQWVTLTQAAPDFPEAKIIYKWNPARKIYFPSRCYLGMVNKWREIDCREAYR